MNKLRLKIKIRCITCLCILHRKKTIKVTATNKAEAIQEANEKTRKWKMSLVDTNCKTCQSIIDSV